MDKQMDIYQTLKKDHETLKGLLDQLVSAEQPSADSKANLIGQIRDELVPHSRAEEATFYNPLRTIDESHALVMHGYQEHIEAESMLRLLQTLDMVSVDWKNLAVRLKKALEHHIDEEENKIFPTAKQLLTKEEAVMMGSAFSEAKRSVQGESFIESTADLVANLLPVRFSESVREFIRKPFGKSEPNGQTVRSK